MSFIIFILKMASGLLIGMNVGKFMRKHELSAILGLCLTVALTLAACIGIDKLFGTL